MNCKEPCKEEKSPNRKGDKMKREIAETLKEAEFLARYPQRNGSSLFNKDECLKKKETQRFECHKKKCVDIQDADHRKEVLEPDTDKCDSKTPSTRIQALPPLIQNNIIYEPSTCMPLPSTYLERESLKNKLNIWLFNLKIQECFIIRTLYQLQQQAEEPIV